CLEPECEVSAQPPCRGPDLRQPATDRRIIAHDVNAACPRSIRICAPGSLRSHEHDMSRSRHGKRCVGRVKHLGDSGKRRMPKHPPPAFAKAAPQVNEALELGSLEFKRP